MKPCSLLLALVGLVVAGQMKPAVALDAVEVTDEVYAIVGDLTNRSPRNYGNNATFGLVVTSEGAVLIDPGGSYRGAEAIHAAIKAITELPVRLVINTGGQDHRWLGNGYFKRLGAEIIASRAAVADQKERARDQYNVLATLVGEAGLAGTEAVFAERVFDEELRITLGDTAFEIVHRGAAHTPGDAIVWLPQKQVVFSGDVAYTERLLGVIDVSDSRNWLAVFEAMAARRPQHVVPGHGHPTTLARARQDTYEYLVALRNAVREFMDAGGDISDIGSVDQSDFERLANFEMLSGRNAQRVFEELEWE